ncbi:MAG: outer membrane protein, partial [Porticoccaceae bacterium]
SYKDDFGFALNLGFDYVINERSYFNVDLKKYKLSTDTVIDAGDAGIATASVDLDPLAISVGFGWKF